MIEVFYIGQGDTGPAYPGQVRDRDGAVDLSLAAVTQVYFCMARISTGSVVVSAPATVTNVERGELQYDWAVADTGSTGEFAASFLFVTTTGSFTLPRSEMAKIVVEDKFVIGDS